MRSALITVENYSPRRVLCIITACVQGVCIMYNLIKNYMYLRC